MLRGAMGGNVRWPAAALIGVLTVGVPCLADERASTPVFAEHGMIVSASKFASEAGVSVMRNGGNAIDAAVATGFALSVTYPQAGNLGGGGFLVAYLSSEPAFTIDFREKASQRASRDMFVDAEGNVMTELSLRSPLASGVPGSVDGLLRAWADHGSGRISRREVLAPAIDLASSGFSIGDGLARALNVAKALLARDPSARKIFVRPDGRAWRAGDRLVQTDLARTLKRIARHGRRGFYGGRTATLLAEQMGRTGGLISLADLAGYASIYREPVRGSFDDFEILSMGPPSSGGVLVIEMLNMLEDTPFRELDRYSAPYVHMLTEAQRRAYADRAEHLGDPDFWRVPVGMLTDKSYARERAKDISLDRATPSEAIRAGAAWPRESTETTHYSVVDEQGNAVAVTTTLNSGFGSGIVVGGAGFLLNNEMDDFSAKPGSPNLYGLVGNEANAIVPNKRMLSSMSPTIVLHDGRPLLILGSPGGATIITTVLQVFLNFALHGMNIQEAVSAPRHHSQWLPDRISFEEAAFNSDLRSRLRALGHTLQPLRGRGIGQANCIHITEEGVFGAPDPRGDNVAVGY